jgi:hypothetical protein
MNTSTPAPSAPLYKGFRFPPEIISHAVWLYFRFSLSFRDVEELLAQRGVIVTYETVRQWCLKFGQTSANELRRRRPRCGNTWHLDEVVLTIRGQKQRLPHACNNDFRSRQRCTTKWTISTTLVPLPRIAGGMANSTTPSHWAPSKTIPPLPSFPMAFHTNPNRDGHTIVCSHPLSLSLLSLPLSSLVSSKPDLLPLCFSTPRHHKGTRKQRQHTTVTSPRQ